MITKTIGTLWRMSLQASVLILFLLTVHPFLKRYPKIYSYSLWVLVGISLLCPISIPSPFSLQPDLPDSMPFLENSQDTGTMENPENFQNPAASFGPLPENAQTTNPLQTGGSMRPDSGLQTQTPARSPEVNGKAGAGTAIHSLLCALYLTGVGIVSLRCFLQYRKVRRQTAAAVLEGGNVWLCETVSSPFIIGIRNPRILLPYTLTEPEKSHILQHERTHIRHHDPFARLLALICVCLHWWNPLVWLAACFMEQDMEMFCDESALQHATLTERKAYAKTLLSCAGRQSGLALGPAFGESNTERRVKNIMKKRKNNLIVLFCVTSLAVFCVVAFMTTPKAAQEAPNTQEAPVYFNYFALANGVVYQGLPEDEIADALPLPVRTDYCAIYNNELYYAANPVDHLLDYVADGHLAIYRCGLDGTNPQKILELPEINYITEMMLRDGYLYCGYLKTEDDDAVTVAKVRTSGEEFAEYQIPGEYGGWLLFSDGRAYSRALADNREMIFYVHHLETGETRELYRCSGYFLEDYSVCNGKLLLLLSNNENLTLLSVDENKNIRNYGNYEGLSGHLLSGKSTYCSINTALYQLDETKENWIPLENILPEGVQAYNITPLAEDGNLLYYIVGGEVPDDEWSNTFLMQYNTEEKECKLLRAYYSP